MKIKKRVQKLIALALALITLSNCVAVAFASERTLPEVPEYTLDSLMQPFENCVSVNEDGIFEIDSVAFNEVLAENGASILVFIPPEAGIETVNEIRIAMTEGVMNINAAITGNELVFVDSDTLVDASDDSYYLQGGSTYYTYHWWGITHYKSTADAGRWVRDLNRAAQMNAVASAVAGAVFCGWGAIPNAAAAAYAGCLANDVSYYNSLTQRGIIAKIYWILAYNIRNQ